MELIPAWVIVILTALVTVDNIVNYRYEKNLLLLGKIFSWGLASLIYIIISLGLLSTEQARILSRWGWTIIPITELAYRYAKVKWKI